MDRYLTLGHLKALRTCVEIAEPSPDEIEGPVSDESLAVPFEQWSDDRVHTVATEAIKILFDKYERSH